MKTEIQLSDAFGKTLEGAAFSMSNRQAVLTFTDGSFTTLDIERGFERGDEEIIEGSLEFHDFGDEKLEALGIFAPGELPAIREERNKKRSDYMEKLERETLAKLQQKYGQPK